ncbi:MAG: DUF92 domain-containing protein [Nitrososphaerota archaeon]|nr:DUF92 domain-containing protein [Nitrososphaerota archaeon]
MAALAAVAELYLHQEVFAVAFLASIAAANSDTVATEVGLLSGSKPRAITDLRRVVEPGTSGGVSLLGELAAIGSSIGIATLGLLLHTIPSNSLIAAFISVVVGALFGTNFDSLLGGTVQGVRRCQICGAQTESRNHHNEPTKLDRGSRFVDNNVVNFVAILAGTSVAMLAFAAL